MEIEIISATFYNTVISATLIFLIKIYNLNYTGHHSFHFNKKGILIFVI